MAVFEDAEQNLSLCMRRVLERLWQEWKQLDSEIRTVTCRWEGEVPKTPSLKQPAAVSI